MQHFLILLREDLNQVREMSEQEMQQDIAEYTRWVEELSASGNFVSGEPLEPVGRLVKRDEILTDGPFIEAKDAISGYFIIRAESLEQAADIARSCPLFRQTAQEGQIELRPIMQY